MALYWRLGDPDRRLQCARNALRCDPNGFRVHQRLANCLAGLGQLAEAKEHLDWCLKRKPDDQRLLDKEKEIMRKEILGRRGTTADRRAADRRAADRDPTAGSRPDDLHGASQARPPQRDVGANQEPTRTY